MDATALDGGCILGGILEAHISTCNLDSAYSVAIGITNLGNLYGYRSCRDGCREFKELKSSEGD